MIFIPYYVKLKLHWLIGALPLTCSTFFFKRNAYNTKLFATASTCNTYYVVCMLSYFACTQLLQLCSVFRNLFCTWHLYILYIYTLFIHHYKLIITLLFDSEYRVIYIPYIECIIILCTYYIIYNTLFLR